MSQKRTPEKVTGYKKVTSMRGYGISPVSPCNLCNLSKNKKVLLIRDVYVYIRI